MKLQTLINDLEKAKAKYIKKYGIEPVIWSWDADGIELCAKRKVISRGTIQAVRPAMLVKISLPGTFW